MKQNLNKQWDFRAITLCIIIAILVWLFNALNQTYTTHITYPVIFKTNQSEVVALIPPPTTLKLEVTGKGWNVLNKNLGIGVEPITIDLLNVLKTKKFDSKRILHYLTANIKDLKINHIIPDTLVLHYDRVVGKKVNICLSPSQIPFRDGYRLTSKIEINPKQVLFKGAATVLATFPDTLFLRLEDAEIENNYEQTVSISYPARTPAVYPETTKVKVNFQTSFFVQRNLLVPISLVNFPSDSSVTIAEKSIILHYWFKKEHENRIFADTIRAIVNFKNRNLLDSTIVPVAAYLPKKIENISFTPSKIKLIYAKNTKNRDNRRNRSR
ncbi:MAG: hypothetical protein EAZ08_05385 [Cytophagales bacterium]|nr:MAG: hypothetical protein EAZ08_05385 [Cytophagales bacterium]